MRFPTGLKVKDVTIGAGDVAKSGQHAAVRWRGFLNRGDEFGSGTTTFHIGKRQVIAGLDRGVLGMRVGGLRRLLISPHLGYREQEVPGIPANAVLTFEIELLEVTG